MLYKSDRSRLLAVVTRSLNFLLLLGGAVAIASTGVAQDLSALRQEIIETPNSAAAIVTQTIKAAGPNGSLVAAPVTAAGIQALGSGATARQVEGIVYAAVRLQPDYAIQIVRAAVKVAPSLSPEIAAAAVRAVPNPWKEVRYQAGEQPAQSVQPVSATSAAAPSALNLLATGDSIRKEPDFKSPVDDTILDPPAPGDPMSLAEAIVQAAGGDPSVQTEVDAALYGHPGSLFGGAGDPRGYSGIGDAGNSNYTNEPHDPGGPPTSVPPNSPPPPNPPSPPNPPPVSP